MNMSDTDVLNLKRFGAILNKLSYSDFNLIIAGSDIYCSNPLPDYYLLKREIKKIPPGMRDLFAFLMLGDPVNKLSIIQKFDRDIIHTLQKLDIMNSDNSECWLNNFVMISYCNMFFFVSNPHYYPTNQDVNQHTYIGPDSYWLSNFTINRTGGKILDLCTGSGIQAILSARTAERVVGVDLDENACIIARINAIINNLEHKVSFLNGDLYRALNEIEKFDIIMANPPFLPIPENLYFPLSGNGGTDGLSLIMKIVDGLKYYLNDTGTCYITGQTPGFDNHVFLSDQLRMLLPNFCIHIIYSDRIPIEYMEIMLSEYSSFFANQSLITREYIRNDSSLKANCLYKFHLCVSKQSNDFSEHFINDNWRLSDIPKTNASWTRSSTNYQLSNGKNHIIVNKDIFEFVKRIDGKKSISEIIQDLPIDVTAKFGENFYEYLSMQFAATCGMLERKKIIENHSRSN